VRIPPDSGTAPSHIMSTTYFYVKKIAPFEESFVSYI
jgi:hypothetical protein